MAGGGFRIVKCLVMIVLSGGLVACATTSMNENNNVARLQEPASLVSVEGFESRFNAQLDAGDLVAAVSTLDVMELQYPFSVKTQASQLRMAEAYYEAREPVMAIAAAKRFARMFPGYKDVDYAYYVIAMSGFAHGVKVLSPASDYPDPAFALASIQEFDDLIKNYPDSRYVSDARHYQAYLVSLVAQYEYERMATALDFDDKALAYELGLKILTRYPETTSATRVAMYTFMAADVARLAAESLEAPQAAAEPRSDVELAEQPATENNELEIVSATVVQPKALPAGGFTIQISSDRRLARLRQYMEASGLHGSVLYVQRKVGDDIWHAAVYGRFKSFEEARQALPSLEQRLQRTDLWIRPLTGNSSVMLSAQ